MSSQAGHMESFGGINTDHGSQDGKNHRRKNSVELFPPQMTNKMKGLFKGLRYISQIFDPNAKEHEMQIGHPTDVKHVAHIGWDGPSAVSAPTWMSEFKSGPDLSSTPLGFGGDANNPASTLSLAELGSRGSQSSDMPELPKPSRRHHSSSSTRTRDGSTRSRDPSESRHSRRQQQQNTGNDGESQAGEKPAVPKSSRKKKTKGSTAGGGSTSERLKADPDQQENVEQSLPVEKEKEKEMEQENET